MTEVKSLSHALSRKELFQVPWALCLVPLLRVSLIEAPIAGIFCLLLKLNLATTLVIVSSVPLLNLAVASTMLSIRVARHAAIAAQMSLTYTFDQARYRVDVVNGQSAIFPYSTLYKVRPFQDGVILEVHRSQGHWIRPSHFATRQEFDQVREWIAAAGKGR